MKPCPCHSGKIYTECCQPFHEGALPQTALALMRARYAAYALQLPNYIMLTTHADSPGFMPDRKEWARQILQFCRKTQFEGLDILDFQDGPHAAIVIFNARLKQKGKDASFIEKSFFEKVDGRWFYFSGTKGA